jgi:hypothetical protein
MPRTPAAIPDPTAGTIGDQLTLNRVAAGFAGVNMTFVHPADPDGAAVFTAAQLTPASQTALQTIYNEVIALFRAQRGYV